MKALLLIPCSASKRRQPAKPIRAIERYDGIFYRVLRKASREGRLPREIHIRILSARYGLITPQTHIPWYEQRMTAARAAELRPGVQRTLRRLLRNGRFDHIFVNLGRDYMLVVEDLPDLRRADLASGAIGKRARALRDWIDTANHAVMDTRRTRRAH